jgi:hypothetical protein
MSGLRDRVRPIRQANPRNRGYRRPQTNRNKGSLVKQSFRLSGIVVSAGIVTAALWGSSVSPSSAANINIGGSECQAGYQAESQDTVLHVLDSVSSLGNVASLPYIVCSLPRSPLAPGATFGGFYVDGDNFFGATTTCTVWSIDYTGLYLGSVTGSSSQPAFDMFLSLPSAQLPTYAYTYLTCRLAKWGNSDVRGVTSLQ